MCAEQNPNTPELTCGAIIEAAAKSVSPLARHSASPEKS